MGMQQFMRKKDPEIGWFVAIMTYISYALLIMVGHIRDFLGSLTGISRYIKQRPKAGYGDLLKSWECFYTRRLYHRIQDCWNRPICSSPGAHIEVMERTSEDNNCTLTTTGKILPCINLGSYNYLGFADDWQKTCGADVINILEKWPVSMCASRMDFGTINIHQTIEKTVARFVGKEAAIVYAVGYGTNTSTISSLFGEGCLFISDSLNHTSIINGARGSKAQIRVFKSNNIKHLEDVLREAIIHGQPRHHRPWKKILVMVEGIYSMEGCLCNLQEIVRVCKRYKAYIYVDEAHSIGALGKTGRGICEHTGVDPADIDILMGTFSKSFAAMGGYIASSQRVIDHLRSSAPGVLYHNALPPVACAQIQRSLQIIMGEDGSDIGKNKLASLNENSNYFRSEMIKCGFHVYGDFDSPVIPVMLYFPCKISAFSRECLKRGLAVVVVGFPATSVILSRARFCVSAAHTKQDLETAVRVLNEVAEVLCLKYSKNVLGF